MLKSGEGIKSDLSTCYFPACPWSEDDTSTRYDHGDWFSDQWSSVTSGATLKATAQSELLAIHFGEL